MQSTFSSALPRGGLKTMLLNKLKRAAMVISACLIIPGAFLLTAAQATAVEQKDDTSKSPPADNRGPVDRGARADTVGDSLPSGAVARLLLADLAAGGEGAPLTLDAAAALKRLASP